jgi:hypothetical protein
VSVEFGCECSAGSGLAHSHIFTWLQDDSDPFDIVARPVDTGEIRIWVDWKAVARAADAPRLLDLADDRELRWWREVFATRICPCHPLPAIGAALGGRPLAVVGHDLIDDRFRA